jgi:hypothetical protein
MAISKYEPYKYRVIHTEGEDNWYVKDADGKTVCTCDKPYNAKLICRLLEKFS